MNCITCGKELTREQIKAAAAFNKEPKFCCKKHYTEFRNRLPTENKYCLLCNKELTIWQIKHHKKYCSKTCGGYANRKYPVDRKCKQCGRQLSKDQISTNNDFCCHNCEGLGRRLPKHAWRYKERFCVVCGKKIDNVYNKKACSIFCRKQLYYLTDIFPNYNKQACDWFKKFDETNQTNGQYALYGGGEYRIRELNYWVDYINFDKKLIMEWDEYRHNKSKYKVKDPIRQEKISNLFQDYNFIRINEEKYNEYPLKLEELLEVNKRA